MKICLAYGMRFEDHVFFCPVCVPPPPWKCVAGIRPLRRILRPVMTGLRPVFLPHLQSLKLAIFVLNQEIDFWSELWAGNIQKRRYFLKQVAVLALFCQELGENFRISNCSGAISSAKALRMQKNACSTQHFSK